MVLYPRHFPVEGFTPFPWLILIRSDRRGDEALLAHEMEHIRQMKEHGWLRFAWRYLTNCAFRMRMEVQAYRVQVQHGGSPWGAAFNLSTKYWLPITYTQAVELFA